ncbi:hypothetical protein HYN59_13880 [Flavobacterium album]|uniref:HTH araC/xylS-type domain-containing protein n=1 Tax=Flavobacterium album TaxID=2175091 RepID=A0A2S1R0E4_9FLAO|nr:helix-turn-helix domain-containing protein [Flavobacterium album]AWH86132.1 hypothetical protein HYN59_13880 [Flavobacterium album]
MMSLQHIPIHPALKGYVEKVWIFRSSEKIADEDMKLVVPNGLPKLVVPFCNGLSGTMPGWKHMSKENSITLIGICDVPSIVDVQDDAESGTIGVEFTPMGISRFFNIRQADIHNRIYALIDVVGKKALEIEEQITDEPSPEKKAILLQHYLLKIFNNGRDPIFEYCVSRIRSSKGMVQIKHLERETGYSSRWLTAKFDEKLGISPKNLCSVVRFHTAYQAFSFNQPIDVYGLYYDQSHFIREFKRFTGMPPGKFEKQVNDFDKIFYR